MGQRAVIAYNDGINTRITTNQWSTRLSEMIRVFVETRRKENENFNFDAFATDMFNKIVGTDHVSCIEIMEEGEKQHPYDPTTPFPIERSENGDTLVVFASHYGEESSEIVEDGTDIETAVKNHPHAQDGISMYYTKGEGKIHFYIDPGYLKLDTTDGSNVPTFAGTPFHSEVA